MDVFGFGFNGFGQLQLSKNEQNIHVWNAAQVVLQPEKLFFSIPEKTNSEVLKSNIPSSVQPKEETGDAKEQKSRIEQQNKPDQCSQTQCLETIFPQKNIKDNSIEDLAIGWDRILYCMKEKETSAVSLLQHGPHSPHCNNESTVLRKNTKHVFVSWLHTYIVNSDGQCLVSDNSAEEPKFRPVQMVSQPGVEEAKIEKVAAGEKYVMALLEGSQVGMIERDQDRDTILLRPLNLQLNIKAMSCGKEHVILLTRIGVVLTMGIGGQGQLGHGDVENKPQPTIIHALQGVSMVDIAAGGWHSVALSDIGDVYTWGWNERGQLGLPSKVVREQKDYQGQGQGQGQGQDIDLVNIQPLPGVLDIIDGGDPVDIKAISAGSRHTAAISEDGTLFTWGWNQYGQLGHGDTVSRDQPTVVKSFKDRRLSVARVYSGWWNTVVVAQSTEELSANSISLL